MDITKGYLLITDITGYTEFLVESELEHAKEILDTLLETNIKSIEPPVRILNTRGDAVLAFAEESAFVRPESLLETIDKAYFDYRRQLELMVYNTTCPCKACANMGSLDLKIFLHHGEYMLQQINEAEELQGADVILANRLMKNQVKEKTGLTGYALVTEAAIRAMDAGDLTNDMIAHSEAYEHFGDVDVRIENLQQAWDIEREKRRSELTAETAWVCASAEVPVPPWVAWDHATDLEQKRKYFGMISVSRTGDDGGRVKPGSTFHCQHEFGDINYMVTDWSPPNFFSSDEKAFGLSYQFAMRISPTESGSKVEFLWGTPTGDNVDEMAPLYKEASQAGASGFADLIKEARATAESDRGTGRHPG